MYNVLIADDELLVISSMKKRVNWEEHGFAIIAEASNGIEAYEKILELRPDIVFTDIRMPGMNGLDLMRKVNEMSMNTRFVVISGYADFDYARQAVNIGALGYCLKPFERNELWTVLERVRKELERDKAVSRNGPVEGAEVSNREGGVSADTVRTALETPHEDNTGNETYLKILNYINVNYRKDITVQSAANAFYTNPNYISQLFKRKKGETFTEYLTSLRIGYACSLLKTSDTSVHEIADCVGYNDYFYFAKVFKKATGMTPKVYRKTEKMH